MGLPSAAVTTEANDKIKAKSIKPLPFEEIQEDDSNISDLQVRKLSIAAHYSKNSSICCGKCAFHQQTFFQVSLVCGVCSGMRIVSDHDDCFL
jgi:hypothetical protein